MAKKPPARRKGKGGGFDRWIVAGIVISLVVIALTLWGPLRKFRPHGEKRPGPRTGQESTSRPSLKIPQASKGVQPSESGPALLGGAAPGKTVLVAIVIDDLGMDLKQAREILSLPANVTFAVMPRLPQSKKVAELARENDREVLLHLPMEYRSKNGKPAAGMLLADMTPMEFLNTVSEDVASVPGAVGINNHEGSALTENKEAMKFLMAELKARNLMFLDSLTTAHSVAYETAREFGLKAAKRDVFLDNDADNPASIRKQLDELLEIARKHGRAIGIGHPHPATVIEIKKWLADENTQDVEIVPVSKLMN